MPATLPAPSVVTKRQLVMQTFLCAAKRHPEQHSHFEIHFAPDDERDAPKLVVVTRAPDLFAWACAAEGTGRRFDVTWHPGLRADRTRAQLLDALEEVS
jgi:hypothetical protein